MATVLTVVTGLLCAFSVACAIISRQNAARAAEALVAAAGREEAAAEHADRAEGIWRGDAKLLEICQTMPAVWATWQEQATATLTRVQAARREIDRSIDRKEQATVEEAEKQAAIAANAAHLQALLQQQADQPLPRPAASNGRLGRLHG